MRPERPAGRGTGVRGLTPRRRTSCRVWPSCPWLEEAGPLRVVASSTSSGLRWRDAAAESAGSFHRRIVSRRDTVVVRVARGSAPASASPLWSGSTRTGRPVRPRAPTPQYSSGRPAPSPAPQVRGRSPSASSRTLARADYRGLAGRPPHRHGDPTGPHTQLRPSTLISPEIVVELIAAATNQPRNCYLDRARAIGVKVLAAITYAGIIESTSCSYTDERLHPICAAETTDP